MRKLSYLGVFCALVIAAFSCGNDAGRRFDEDDSKPCLLPERAVDAAPSSIAMKKAASACHDCWKDISEYPGDKEQADKTVAACRTVAPLELKGSAAPYVMTWKDGFQAVSFFKDADTGKERSMAVRRYDEDGLPTSLVEWEGNWSYFDRFAAGPETTLWIHPQEIDSGRPSDWWNVECVKDSAPKGMLAFTGHDPRAVWHEGRFVVLFHDDGALYSIVIGKDCAGEIRPMRKIGNAAMVRKDGVEVGPFISRFVSARGTLGILMAQKVGRSGLAASLATFRFEGERLVPSPRATVSSSSLPAADLGYVWLNTFGRDYMIGIGPGIGYKLTTGGPTRARVPFRITSPSGRRIGWLPGDTDAIGFMRNAWIFGVWTDDGYALQCETWGYHGVSHPRVVSKHDGYLIGNGEGLFALTADEPIEGRWQDTRPLEDQPTTMQNRYEKRAAEELAGRYDDPSKGSRPQPHRVSLISCR
jgi:hypothetical protein